MPGDGVGQLARSGLLDEKGRGTGVQREHQSGTEAEGECERSRRGEQVVGLGPQDVAAERVGVGHDVAVEVHRDLRPAGGARREGEQRDVVGRRLYRFEPALRVVGEPDEIVLGVAAVRHEGHGRTRELARGLHVVEEAVVADRQVGLRQLDGRDQLARAQQRHRQHDDTAGQYAEPGGDEPRVVGSPEQHRLPGCRPSWPARTDATRSERSRSRP